MSLTNSNTTIEEDVSRRPLYARRATVDYGHELVASVSYYPGITKNSAIDPDYYLTDFPLSVRMNTTYTFHDLWVKTS